MTKKQAQAQAAILEKYRKAMKLSLTEFAKVLKTSRQSYYLWLDGTEIKQETLSNMAVNERGQLVGELAVELLKARNSPLPCVCETQVMDHGFCPRHSKVIFTAAVS